jgi:hypothetical protein
VGAYKSAAERDDGGGWDCLRSWDACHHFILFRFHVLLLLLFFVGLFPLCGLTLLFLLFVFIILFVVLLFARHSSG